MYDYKKISENICTQLLLNEPDIGNKASFYTLKRWPTFVKNIYITFLEDPPFLFPVKSISDLQNGNLKVILDPLQYKFSNSIITPDLKETIKEIVAERIQPRILSFRTNEWSDAGLNEQLQALRKTIDFFD